MIRTSGRTEGDGKRRGLNSQKKLFKYLSGPLEAKRSGVLKDSREEVEEHLRNVHSERRREEELDLRGRFCCPDEPVVPFEEGEPIWQEVNDFIRCQRVGSLLRGVL